MLLGMILFPTFISCNSGNSLAQLPSNPREGWAVFLEMNDYPGSGSDLNTGFSDSHKWNTTLQVLDWQLNHIRFYQGELTQLVGESALTFLRQNADANDVILFLIFAHGSYILNTMNWLDWFPTQWGNLPSQEKVLIVLACGSEEMLPNPLGSYVHIASSQVGEYSWAGLPEESLPIIGDVFNHYFTNALLNSSADENGDSEVSLEEAFEYASPLSRDYITNVVFPAFPYYSELSNNTAPHPVLDDNYTGDFSMQVESGDPPLPPPVLSPFEISLFIFAVGLCTILAVIGLFIIRKRQFLH
jgi:hypothetical protein